MGAGTGNSKSSWWRVGLGRNEVGLEIGLGTGISVIRVIRVIIINKV